LFVIYLFLNFVFCLLCETTSTTTISYSNVVVGFLKTFQICESVGFLTIFSAGSSAFSKKSLVLCIAVLGSGFICICYHMSRHTAQNYEPKDRYDAATAPFIKHFANQTVFLFKTNEFVLLSLPIGWRLIRIF